MGQQASNAQIDIRFFNALIQSCSDFIGNGHDIDIEISGLSWEESALPTSSPAELEIAVSVLQTEHERIFKFKTMVSNADVLPLGPFIANANVTLPCEVFIQGARALDCLGTCQIVAKRAQIETPDLIVRNYPYAGGVASGSEPGLFLNVGEAQGHASAVALKGGALEINCIEHGLAFPLAKYVHKTENVGADPAIADKFRRLRRILSEFASHSKGRLAKYRDKIDHERVLRGKTGSNVLEQLQKEGILYTDPKFYFVNSENLSKVLGTTWHELRQNRLSKPVEAFLKRVP
jgi:hypothetical protein